MSLNERYLAYCLNGNITNYLLFADDLVLFSPTAAAMNELHPVCEQFSKNVTMKFNEDCVRLL